MSDDESDLKNRQFADKLREKMAADLPPGTPPGSHGWLKLDLMVKGNLVALRYAEDCVVAFPVETARQLAQGLLRCADEIDGRRSFVFLYGTPPRPEPGDSRDGRPG